MHVPRHFLLIMSIPKLGSPTCWLGSLITRSPTWRRCYRGIGATRSLSPALPDMAAPASAVTISRAAEILGEDEELLWDMAIDMEPEDGCLWIYGTDDQQTVAFTADGIDYLREMLAEYKRRRSSPRP